MAVIYSIILIIFFILFFVKKNDNYFLITLGIDFGAILSNIILMAYLLLYLQNGHIAPLDEFILQLAIIIFTSIFDVLIFVIVAIMYFIKFKNEEGINIKKYIIKPFLIVTFITFLLTFVNFGCSVIINKIEKANNEKIKTEEVNKMADFLNNKYGLSLDDDNCILFRKKDYNFHGDVFGNGSYYNIPYVCVFDNDGEKITVVDRDGYISDNREIQNIGYLMAKYFSKIAGTEIEYVEVRNCSNGYITDYLINDVIQNNFNEKFSDNNISDFINKLLLVDNLEINFYLKDSDDIQIEELTSKLEYLGENKNIKILKIIIFDDNFLVNKIDSDIMDLYDYHKFNFYYVDKDVLLINKTASLILDRGYNVIYDDNDIKIGNWIVKE